MALLASSGPMSLAKFFILSAEFTRKFVAAAYNTNKNKTFLEKQKRFRSTYHLVSTEEFYNARVVIPYLVKSTLLHIVVMYF